MSYNYRRLLEKEIEKIIIPFNFSLSKRNGTLDFTIEVDDLTFDKLSRLSRLLKTKIINIGAGAGGCPTCGVEAYVKVSCSQIPFDEVYKKIEQGEE